MLRERRKTQRELSNAETGQTAAPRPPFDAWLHAEMQMRMLRPDPMLDPLFILWVLCVVSLYQSIIITNIKQMLDES